MTDQTCSEEEKKRRESSPLYEVSRRLLLAAIGAATLAQDELEDFVRRLVERGEIAEKDGKSLVKEILEKRNITKHEIEIKAHKRIHDALDHWNIPTREDINDLSEKITALTQKVEELRKSKE